MKHDHGVDNREIKERKDVERNLVGCWHVSRTLEITLRMLLSLFSVMIVAAAYMIAGTVLEECKLYSDDALNVGV